MTYITKTDFGVETGVIINNKEWGIVADGITDDTPGIKAALEGLAAKGHKKAILTDGTYFCERDGANTWAIDAIISIAGESRDNTIIKFPEFATNTKGIVVYEPGITIENLTLDGGWQGNTLDNNRHNIFIGQRKFTSNPPAEGVTVRNVTSINADGDGVYISESSKVLVEGTKGSPGLIYNCARNSITLGSNAEDIVIRHFDLKDCRTQHIDAEPVLEGHVINNVLIEHVGFYTSTNGGAAIATPSADKDLPSKNWIIRNCEFYPYNGGIQLRWVDGAIIEGNTFYATDGNDDFESQKIYVRRKSRNCKIINNSFQFRNKAILTDSNPQTYDDLENLIIEGNTFYGLDPVNVATSGQEAISLGGGSNVLVRGNQILFVGDDFTSHTRIGISVNLRTSYERLLISENTITNTHEGIRVLKQAGNPGTVRNFTIADNYFRAAPEVTSVTEITNTRVGIRARTNASSDPSFDLCHLYGNTFCGFDKPHAQDFGNIDFDTPALAITPGSGQNELSWAPLSGVLSYDLYYGLYPSINSNSALEIENEPHLRLIDVTSPYTHDTTMSGTSPLEVGYTYYYTAVANYTIGCGPDATVVSGTVL